MFLHIDIDAFFVSAERSVNPSLRRRPVAVGSRSNLEIFDTRRTHTKLMQNNSGAFVTPVFYNDKVRTFENYFVDRDTNGVKIRGIVTTASYEARAFGVKTGMPIAQALRLCPELIVIPAHYPLYHTLSAKLRHFLKRRIPSVEQFSIDEFFADTAGWIDDTDTLRFAYTLQSEIYNHFALPVSIGISRAKWIAKLATEYAKPYGIYMVEDLDDFIETIPIERFPGIGKGFAQRLGAHHIRTLGDLKRARSLLYRWHKPGIRLYLRVTGQCGEGIGTKTPRKSIGISRTFDPIYDTDEIKRRVMVLARHIAYMTDRYEVLPTVYFLYIKYEHGIRVKRRYTCNRLFSESLFKRMLTEMYDEIALPGYGAVKLSLSVSGFVHQHPKTLSILSYSTDTKQHGLTRHIQLLRRKFGIDIVKTGNEL